jgi:probable H4MPT-linked C1 transfer pathway protein
MSETCHPDEANSVIGIDIGGANLKIYASGGLFVHYCPLWIKAPIQEILRSYHAHEISQKVAVVMSGELADSFSSKAEGIAFIVQEVKAVFPDAQFYGIDGVFHTQACIELAAANWFSACNAVKSEFPKAVLVDMGSTTTDIIPLQKAQDLMGYTDLKRLQAGYLLYTGILRTPIATLISEVVLDGQRTPVSTEFFANAADAHMILGSISQKLYTCERADGGSTDYQACVRRISRVLCSDPEEIGKDGAACIAQAFVCRQKEIIVQAVQAVCRDNNASEIVCAGIGASLLASWLSESGLICRIHPYAEALPAYSVAYLLAGEI